MELSVETTLTDNRSDILEKYFIDFIAQVVSINDVTARRRCDVIVLTTGRPL